MLGSKKEFAITKAQTHSPVHGAAYQWSEPNVIPFSYSGAPTKKLSINTFFKWTNPSFFFSLFLVFSNTKLTVGFSRIQTRMIGVEGYHLGPYVHSSINIFGSFSNTHYKIISFFTSNCQHYDWLPLLILLYNDIHHYESSDPSSKANSSKDLYIYININK